MEDPPHVSCQHSYPYQVTKFHGENFLWPPPELVNGEEEWEVEKIMDTKCKGQGQKLYYLIKWRGFLDGDDSSWESQENIFAPEVIAKFVTTCGLRKLQALAPDGALNSTVAKVHNLFPFIHKLNTLDHNHIILPAGWDSCGDTLSQC
jgi:hypothetical protein